MDITKKIQNAQKDLPVDLIGSIIIVCATSCFVLVVTWGGVTYAWNSSIIISLIIVCAVLFGAFVVQELRHPEPVIRFELYKIRNYTFSTIVMFLFGMAMFGGFTFVPFYFEDVLGNSAIIAGLKIFPLVAGVMTCSTITGIIISKTGKFIVFPVLGLSVFSTGLGLCMLMSKKTNYGLDALFLFLVGSGMGFSFPVYNSIVQNSVPPQHMASCISTLVFIRQMGACIGISVLGTVYQRFIKHYVKEYGVTHMSEVYSRSLHKVMEGALIFALIGWLFAFGIRNEKQLFNRVSQKSVNGNIQDSAPAPNDTEGDVEVAAGLAHAI